ncbi:PfkB family carbohydrate kinase [Actinoplanes sp. NPDC049265]|uniref:PfkB family carbohydrate kinase n=1 Tax=Actinoplanes sp. NPDC049265 TaxID=3363902 RepID=UPI003713A366
MRLVCVGLSTVDLVHRVPRIPGPDEKAQATTVEVAAGGPALNAAVTAAVLGADVTLVTAIGSHPLGGLIKQDLEGYGVKLLDAAEDATEPPPLSAVTVEEGTGRRSIVSRNAGAVTPRMPSCDLSGTVLVDGHHPALARAAAERAGTLVVDAGHWRPVFADILPRATVVAASAGFHLPTEATAATTSHHPPTDESAATMTHRPPTPATMTHRPPANVAAATMSHHPPTSVTADATAATTSGLRRPSGEEALAGVAPHVAVTNGPAPVRWWSLTKDGAASGERPVPTVDAVDTAGAGDAFHGALALAIASGASFVEALDEAIRVAAIRVQHAGPRAWLADPRLITRH